MELDRKPDLIGNPGEQVRKIVHTDAPKENEPSQKKLNPKKTKPWALRKLIAKKTKSWALRKLKICKYLSKKNTPMKTFLK